jgi:DNA-binding transcriptional LysR family regulator
VPTHLPPLTRELWLVFHRDVGRAPAVRAVINRITEIAIAARKSFLGELE